MLVPIPPKVCFINPPHEESLDPQLDPPLGLMYLAAVLKQKTDYEVFIIDLSFYNKNIWTSEIRYADIYAITVMTASLHHAVNLLNTLKTINPKCKVIVGGAHPTCLPNEMIALGFDAVIEGEGEEVITNVVSELIKTDNPKRKIYKSFIVPNLHTIPFPDRELLDIHRYTRKVDGVLSTSLLASRGCPYKCAFCINSTKEYYPRFRKTEHIIEEITLLKSRYGFTAFNFLDDTFTIHPEIDLILSELLNMDIIFRCNGNARKDTPELFRRLYQARCREISFGIESGNQTILNKINKHVTVQQNKDAIICAKKAGLKVRAFLMVGSPGECLDSVQDTISFMNETRPDLWTLFNFVPLPGCAIWNNPEKYGIKIITRDYKQYYNLAGQNEGGITIDTEYMTAHEIESARQRLLRELPVQTGRLPDYYQKLREL